jgi:hypothetical protein
MNTYNLKSVEEATIVNGNLSVTTTQLPIDNQGNVPDYISKDRVIQDDKMLVFDTHQEYIDYINNI